MEWRRCSLSQLVDIVGGGTPSKSRPDFWIGETPWVSPKDMNARELLDTVDHINEAAVQQSATRVVPDGSVLIVVRSGILAHRFPIAIARRPVALNQDMKALVPHGHLLPEYLAYALESFSDTVLAHCVKFGATVHSVDVDKLRALPIPLPPLSEQRRIMEILDQADRLRRLRAEADAKAERILPALFIKMFGDPATNPMGWLVSVLGDFLAQVDRRDPGERPDLAFEYIDIAGVDGVGGEIVATRRLLGADAPSRARQVVRAGDVIVSTVRPYLRATALVPSELESQVCSTGFCVLRSKYGYGHGYLYALSRMQWFTDQLNSRARGASYPAVTDRDIWDLRVPLPRAKERLRRFDLIVHQRQAEKRNRRLISSRLEVLFQSLQARAFSGSLTASWREAHMKELLQEMEQQATALATG